VQPQWVKEIFFEIVMLGQYGLDIYQTENMSAHQIRMPVSMMDKWQEKFALLICP
jgi:hypothetical protein